MSHRAIDERVTLQVWLDALDHDIAAMKRATIVDLASLAAMARSRADIAARLARHEEDHRA